jgi:hypothetical protein
MRETIVEAFELVRRYKLRALVAFAAYAWACNVIGHYEYEAVIVNWPPVSPGVWWWNLRGEVAAAWVQAIGSLIGIGFAVAVPYAIHKSERRQAIRDRIVRAEGIAVGLLPKLDPLQLGCNRVAQTMRKHSIDLIQAFAAADPDTFVYAVDFADFADSALFQLFDEDARVLSQISLLRDSVKTAAKLVKLGEREGQKAWDSATKELIDRFRAYETALEDARAVLTEYARGERSRKLAT